MEKVVKNIQNSNKSLLLENVPRKEEDLKNEALKFQVLFDQCYH